MKKSLFLCVHILFLAAEVWSQNYPLPVFEITNDTADFHEINNRFWQILEDPGGKLTIDEVSNPSFSHNFHPDSSSLKGVDNSQHIYWFRMSLRNKMQKEANLMLLNEPYAERFDLYALRGDGRRDHQVNGVFIPYSKRDGFKELEAVSLLLKPGEEVMIYKRIFRATQPYRFTDHLWIGFKFTEKEIRAQYVENHLLYNFLILTSFAFGVLLLASLFNFFFFYINQERVYLLFALFLLLEGLVFFGDPFWLFLLREYPKVRAYAFPLEKSLAIFFLVHFVRYLLHTFRHFPRWDKWLIILSIFPCFFTLLSLFIEPYLPGKRNGSLWLTTTLSNAFLLFSLVATFIFFKKETDRLVRLMLIAVMPVLCLWTITYGFLYIYGALAGRYKSLSDSAFSKWINKLGFTPQIIETACLCWLAIVFTWILFMRYSQLRKENAQQALDKERLAKEKEIEKSELIARQKVELEKQVAERTAELKQSLQDLKSTQNQLIQSEKMASLGELTAGIAHEIQNPLNFVNNFSEVSNELIEELKSEKSKVKSERDERLEDEILNDIAKNLEKINHHGKRADAIVKGMLQHSRSSSGKKEPTDINALADEYLRLAYHGLRAKDKSFNAKFETNFDNSIGKINVVPQHIGRVILNLINNAFYAVTKKKKSSNNSYEPTVTVSTKKEKDKIEIKVADNGDGIPQNVLAKIFQPFFTTKPAGQGTGLGLSLSYDIVKAHGGELKVNTKEGEKSEFVIQLPFD